MFQNLQMLRLAQGLAEHAAARQAVVARNVANADTPGYRQRDIASFAELWRESGDAIHLRRTRQGHLDSSLPSGTPAEFEVAGANADPNGNTVSIESEIMKAAELRQQHELALSIYRAGLNVLRGSLGRR